MVMCVCECAAHYCRLLLVSSVCMYACVHVCGLITLTSKLIGPIYCKPTTTTSPFTASLQGKRKTTHTINSPRGQASKQASKRLRTFHGAKIVRSMASGTESCPSLKLLQSNTCRAQPFFFLWYKKNTTTQ